MVKRAGAVVLLILCSVGCGNIEEGAGSHVDGNQIVIPTLPQVEGGASRLASFHGTLTKNGDCLHLGASPDAPLIVWPHGWTASGDPLQVKDADGRVVAHVGDPISFAGGRYPDAPGSCPHTDNAVSVQSAFRVQAP